MEPKLLCNVIRNKREYSNWKDKILKRDNYQCQKKNCFLRTDILIVHHKKKLTSLIKKNKLKTWEDCLNCVEVWDLDNGITYCQQCHKKVHGYS